MTNLSEQKKEANELRKKGNYEEAVLLYRKLWGATGDKFDGTGLLHCLRKLKLFDEAIPLADELIHKYPDFEWVRVEVIWTYTQGILDRFTEKESHKEIVKAAENIMKLKPNGLAAKKIIFKVLKSAKFWNNWESVNEWVVKIDPNSLRTEPIKDDFGRGGWSDQSLWYIYRIKGLVEKGNEKEAIKIVDEILERFPRQRKYFLRLKASANHLLGELTESEKIYQYLCSLGRTDWWILHEYAKVVWDAGRKEDALKLMCQAAESHAKLEFMVSLFFDIGMLCKEMKKYEEARAHFALCKYVREEKGWNVPEEIGNSVDGLNEIIGNHEPSSLKEALKICRTEWGKFLCKENISKESGYDKRKIRRGLIGKVILKQGDAPFCFIVGKDKQSYFCSKSDLPTDTANGDELTFDAIPSFDKKKNQESWRAKNIQRTQ